jgi:hypothetical protein
MCLKKPRKFFSGVTMETSDAVTAKKFWARVREQLFPPPAPTEYRPLLMLYQVLRTVRVLVFDVAVSAARGQPE